MQRRFNVGISISPTDEKRRLVVFGATPTRKSKDGPDHCRVIANSFQMERAN
jgi:hypothetical protein